MSWWDRRAGRLQDSVKSAESDMPAIDMYEDQAIKRAIVHSREDLVLVYSQLSSLNSQVRTVKWLLAFIAGFLGLAVFT